MNIATNPLPRLETLSVELPSTVIVRMRRSRGIVRADLAGWICRGHAMLAPLLDPLVFSRAGLAEHGAAVAWGEGDDAIMIDALHLTMIAELQRPFGAPELEAWRVVEELSVAEAADLLGLSLSAFKAYRAGENPIPDPIARLCRAVARDPVLLDAHLRRRRSGRPGSAFRVYAKKADETQRLIVAAEDDFPSEFDARDWTLLGTTNRAAHGIAADVRRYGYAIHGRTPSMP